MKAFYRRLLQWVRSQLIDKSCGVMNWCSDQLTKRWENYEDDSSTCCRIINWIDARAMDVFDVAYDGSDEEVQGAIDGDTPIQYLSDRQRAAALEAFPNPCVECNDCQWVGFLSEAPDHHCRSCGNDHLYLRDRSQVWVPYRDHRALVPVRKGGAS